MSILEWIAAIAGASSVYLSARENIFLQAALYGVPRAHVLSRFDDIIEFAGLGDFVDAPLNKP